MFSDLICRPQQTSPVGSVSSGSTQRPNYPVAHAQPATVSHSDHPLHPHNHYTHHQPQHQHPHQPHNRPPVPVAAGPTDPNLNPLHPHHHPQHFDGKTNSRASSSSGGTTAHNSGSGSVIGHNQVANGPNQGSVGNGSNGNGNNNPKQEQRLTHEQVRSG